ncbi:MAG: PilZ domain-containing protein [Caulobacteraceae bacterium]|nr:PilZ domain-containing protein [Caulobacteraceae bacterium]
MAEVEQESDGPQAGLGDQAGFGDQGSLEDQNGEVGWVNRRAHPRRTTAWPGLVQIGEDDDHFSCTIRNISLGGARIAFDSDVDLPKSLMLLAFPAGVVYEAIVAWRIGLDAGLTFYSEHRLDGFLEPRVRRLHRIWLDSRG